MARRWHSAGTARRHDSRMARAFTDAPFSTRLVYYQRLRTGRMIGGLNARAENGKSDIGVPDGSSRFAAGSVSPFGVANSEKFATTTTGSWPKPPRFHTSTRLLSLKST